MALALRPTPAPVPIPAEPWACTWIAVMSPLSSAPSLTLWIESGRLPVQVCSSARSSISLTGLPASRASSPAILAIAVPGALPPNFEPKPPPRNSVMTSTLLASRPKMAANSSRTPKIAWVEAQTVAAFLLSQRTITP